MKLWRVAPLALCAAGCAAPLRSVPPVPAPAGSALTRPVPELAAAIQAAAKRSDHESDSKVRLALASQATADADACLAREPKSAACLYGKALALGLEARVHPTRAGELLSAMLARLGDAEAADPAYDEAGPARVRALVLTRAPGWPLGPGDAEAGLEAARRASSLRPDYAPNLLALAEASAKTGDGAAAHADFERARAAAQAAPASADRDDWLREAQAGLQGH